MVNSVYNNSKLMLSDTSFYLIEIDLESDTFGVQYVCAERTIYIWDVNNIYIYRNPPRVRITGEGISRCWALPEALFLT